MNERVEFTKATKLAAWRRCGGKCEACGHPIKFKPHEFDHVNPAAFCEDNSVENCAVLCPGCHSKKTKGDIKLIAKSNRIRAREAGLLKRSGGIRAWRKFDGTPVYKSRER